MVLDNTHCGKITTAKWLPSDAGVIVTGDSVAVRVWDANEGKVAGDVVLKDVRRVAIRNDRVAVGNADR